MIGHLATLKRFRVILVSLCSEPLHFDMLCMQLSVAYERLSSEFWLDSRIPLVQASSELTVAPSEERDNDRGPNGQIGELERTVPLPVRNIWGETSLSSTTQVTCGWINRDKSRRPSCTMEGTGTAEPLNKRLNLYKITVAWVTRPERPKGSKDKVKRARRASS